MPVWVMRRTLPNAEVVAWIAFLNREAAEMRRASKQKG
jgi:hypothetical protein